MQGPHFTGPVMMYETLPSNLVTLTVLCGDALLIVSQPLCGNSQCVAEKGHLKTKMRKGIETIAYSPKAGPAWI